jgi:DNA-binding transcriptional ArsR family regulator
VNVPRELCQAVHRVSFHAGKREPLRADEVAALSETFKALADPTRLRILYHLSQREMCVCELAEQLGMTQSAVSHQLRYLRNLRLVKYRREGTTVYYMHDDAHIMGLFQMGLDHVRHRPSVPGKPEGDDDRKERGGEVGPSPSART